MQHLILGIDTSCDETSMAVYDAEKDQVLSNIVSSQIRDHAPHGGVVPELASRLHAELLHDVFFRAVHDAGISCEDLKAVAVTTRPGLIGCLLVGVSFAKALAIKRKIAFHEVNHLEAHLFSPFIGKGRIAYPFLGLVVSGGHTAFYEILSESNIQILGQTVDDAAGEAFDKSAKLMGLGYPGGPLVDQRASQGREGHYLFSVPRVKMGMQYLSFSGLKTAVQKTYLEKSTWSETEINNLCADVQAVIVKTLIEKMEYFLHQKKFRAVSVSGGVAMNSRLRAEFQKKQGEWNVPVILAEPPFTTDNGAMIAYRGAQTPHVENIFAVSASPTKRLNARALWKSLS